MKWIRSAAAGAVASQPSPAESRNALRWWSSPGGAALELAAAGGDLPEHVQVAGAGSASTKRPIASK